MAHIPSIIGLVFFCIALSSFCVTGNDDVKYASPCEVCKLVSFELNARLKETGKSHDVIQTGYSLEGGKKNKKKKYQAS